ncbi:S-adenosyl-L-methionine-dependent methyltransferases superfamily protein [Striga hermonthica]|uniref:carnosine N-methyltransferase n=1 Tax=Striga hermonthica TaxID=68872 RepID=A0A9N7N7S9_STRHE|nr:S-adenosyl-L-methionine-dependent methyltransferases superfamily protein [Striga hermonthica]
MPEPVEGSRWWWDYTDDKPFPPEPAWSHPSPAMSRGGTTMKRGGRALSLRRRKLEQALEVKSLRRIISAYLNYPEAAEEDIRRYERCFGRLVLAHKALLLHLPLKFQKLRWCVTQNSCFIFEMLKAFEPPLDMSLDVDISDDQTIANASDNCPLSSEMTVLPCQSGSNSSKMPFSRADGFSSGDGAHGSLTSEIVNEAKNISDSNENAGNCSLFGSDTKVSSSSSPDWLDPSLQFRVPLVDVDKVRCIIRNIVRDWASEGQRERDECYKPILNELERLFPDRSRDSPPACLVPGAGLGRLALEISCLGFISQGNEFSYYMMICSSFILNHCRIAEEWTIYPWIHSNCNSLSDNDQLRPISVPDIHPASSAITDGFSMCGGDFIEVYSDPSQKGVWDAVVTCFFIDTAHNVVEYIEIISRILKDEGVWINLGPLLYHFADMYNQDDEMSIELSLEDVKRVACHYGFQIEKESTIATTYTTNMRSMMQNRYYAAFWTMRKKPLALRTHDAQ